MTTQVQDSNDPVMRDHSLGLSGVIGVLIAPFQRRNGAINEDRAEELARRCDSAGVHVLTVLGNTAEVYQLSLRERMALLAATARGSTTSVLMAGLAGSASDVLDIANEAQALGYHAVMLHEPLDPLASDTGLRDFIRFCLDRTPLPLVLYVRTLRLSPQIIADVVDHPNLVAIKYGRSDIAGALSMMSFEDLGRRVRWICGNAESMVPSFYSLGMRGFTSGLANVKPEMAMGVWEAAEKEDWSLLLDRVRPILPFENVRLRDGGRHNVAAVKYVLSLAGFDAGEVRAPCEPLSTTAKAEVEAIFASWEHEQPPGSQSESTSRNPGTSA